MSVEWIEWVWVALSAVALLLSAYNLRESWLDCRAVQMRGINGKRRAIAHNDVYTQIMRVTVSTLSLGAALYIANLPDPAVYHDPRVWEWFIVAALFLVLAEFAFASYSDILMRRYLNRDYQAEEAKVMGDPKMWYTSKTVWLNVLAIVIAVGYYLMDTPGIVPATYVTYVAAGLGAANLVLRMVTNQPITLRGKKPDAVDAPAEDATNG